MDTQKTAEKVQISIIEFSVENFKIFKERVTFSMLARKSDKHTFNTNGENLLKTSLIYGPNASGKSTLLDAFLKMRDGVLFSANNKEEDGVPFDPCLCFSEAKDTPTFFEIVFSVNGNNQGVYRYNFSYSKICIVTETLVRISESGTEDILFSRKEQVIEVNEKDVFAEAASLKDKTKKYALFLSFALQIEGVSFADEIKEMFQKKINLISGVNKKHVGFTIKKIKESQESKDKIFQYLATADFCIFDGHVKEVAFPGIDIVDNQNEFSTTKRMKKGEILFLKHPVYTSQEKKGDFELALQEESLGTQHFVSILGPVIDTLENGKVLFIDEFDSSLHPLLTKFILDLFESPNTNPHNAQLIVTTHDTSLLSYKNDFIKDQFWFTEKDERGAGHLFSLAEFDMRNDTEYARKYLEGRFGGLPFIGSL